MDGLAGFLIDCDEILEKSERVFSGDLSLTDEAARMSISVRSIRLLREVGYLKQIELRNPDMQHYRCYITEESIQAFEKYYVTMGRIARQFEIAAVHLGPTLNRREIQTITCEAGFVRVYPKETLDVVRKLTMGGKRQTKLSVSTTV